MMLRVALAFALGAGMSLGADHQAASQSHKEEVVFAAGGSLNVHGAAAGDHGLMRREGEQDSPSTIPRQPLSNAHLHSVPIAMHKQELLKGDSLGDSLIESGDETSKDESHATEETSTNKPSAAETTVQTTKQPLVSCGAHQAKKCTMCTVVDPRTGLEIPDRGPDWCHGDCIYYDGECHPLTAQNLHQKRDEGFDNVSTTLPGNDLMNPEITAQDQAIMDAAADKSIGEAEYEAKQELSNQAEAEKEKKGKFLLMVIVSSSAVLLCCAVVSMIVLWRYVKKGEKKPDPLAESEGGDEGSGEDDGEDDGEGEEADAADI